MATIEPEVLAEESKRDRRGRKLNAEGRWRELMAEQASSGLTQAQFARREGINYHTFVGWRGRFRRQGGSTPGPAPRFVEAQLATVPAPGRRLEVVLPGGVVVRGEEAAAVAALVKALGR